MKEWKESIRFAVKLGIIGALFFSSAVGFSLVAGVYGLGIAFLLIYLLLFF